MIPMWIVPYMIVFIYEQSYIVNNICDSYKYQYKKLFFGAILFYETIYGSIYGLYTYKGSYMIWFKPYTQHQKVHILATHIWVIIYGLVLWSYVYTYDHMCTHMICTHMIWKHVYGVHIWTCMYIGTYMITKTDAMKVILTQNGLSIWCLGLFYMFIS